MIKDQIVFLTPGNTAQEIYDYLVRDGLVGDPMGVLKLAPEWDGLTISFGDGTALQWCDRATAWVIIMSSYVVIAKAFGEMIMQWFAVDHEEARLKEQMASTWMMRMYSVEDPWCVTIEAIEKVAVNA